MSSKNLEAYLDVEEREKKGREFYAGSMKRLVKLVLTFPGTFYLGLTFTLLSNGANLSIPKLFGLTIDKGLVPKDGAFIQKMIFIYLGVEIVRVLSAIGTDYVFNLLGQKVMHDLRMKLFVHFQKLPIQIYDKVPVGRLVTRVTNDIASLSDMFTAGFITVVGSALYVFGIVIILFSINVKLAMIVLSVMPPLAFISTYFSRRLKVAYRNSRSRLSALNAFLAENILGMRVVHLFNRQKRNTQRFQELNDWYTEAQFSTVRTFALFQPTITFAATIGIGLLIWKGGEASLSRMVKVGEWVAMVSYSLQLFQPLREIADKWNFFLSGMTSVERIFSILDWKDEYSGVDLTLSDPKVLKLRGHIEFKNVWFAYDAENWVLKNFSLEIKPGECIGIVGPSGSGKTSLVSLLLRFYDFQKGDILLDGKSIREYDKRELRSAFAMVQQDVFLFSGSLRENITLWRRQAKIEGLEKLSSLGKILTRLDAPLQERGSNLSLGERQVVSFARAKLSQPSVWILDEATSSIDSETEKEINDLLKQASRGHTAIVIAHRLSTVKEADRIIVIHRGGLAEQGTHNELLDVNGLYAHLYRFQEADEKTHFHLEKEISDR